MNSEKLALLRHELDLAKRIASDLGMPDGKFGEEADIAWEKVRSLEYEIGMLTGRTMIASNDPVLDMDEDDSVLYDDEDYDLLGR